MNKKSQIINTFLSGNMLNTKLFLGLTSLKEKGLSDNEKAYKQEISEIKKLEKKYGDSGLDGKKCDAGNSFVFTKETIEQKFLRQKNLYEKFCSIALKDNYLYFFITKMLEYGLSEDEKKQALACPNSEIIEIAEKKYLLQKIRIRVPDELQKLDPKKDEEFASWIINNLRGNFLIGMVLAAEWVAETKNYEIIK